MYKYKAEPLSNDIIIDLTQQLRKILGCEPNTPLDIVAILEHAMPQLFKDFDFSIREASEMRVDTHAYTDPQTNQIVIRDDIYERARHGEGRDRFTIAHEIGHYILHNTNMIALTRVYPNESVKPYEDIEWQADAFAGELLCPSCAIRNMEILDISLTYGVSVKAATAQKRKALRCFQSYDC